MKRLFRILTAIAVVMCICFTAVSCDPHPADKPSEPVESGGRGVNAYLSVYDFLNELFADIDIGTVESIDGNPEGFLAYLQSSEFRYRYLLMELMEAAYGEVDGISDTRPHVDIGGERYTFLFGDDPSKVLLAMNPTFTDLRVDSIGIETENGTLRVGIHNIRFKMELTDPITYSADVSIDRLYMEIPVDAVDTPIGTVYSWKYDAPCSIDMAVDGEPWPHFEYVSRDYKAKYGDEEYVMGYTVTLTADADGYPKTLTVPFGVGISSDTLPRLGDPLFRGWKTEDGELIREWDYYPNGGYRLTGDMNLYACMYVKATDDIMDRISRVYRMADVVRNTYEGSMYQVDVTTLLPASDLLDLLLLIQGEIDGIAGEPYLTFNGKHLYGEGVDVSGVPDALVAGKDYNYTVTGIGSSAWSESATGGYRTVHNTLAEANVEVVFTDLSGGTIGEASARVNFFKLTTDYMQGSSGWIEMQADMEISYQTSDDCTVSTEMYYVLGDSPIGYYGEYWFDPDGL